MPRPRIFSKQQQDLIKSLVTERLATPKEIAELLGVSVNTAYVYLHELGLPIHKRGAHLRFYDPSWRLDVTPTPKDVTLERWGVWVKTENIPRDEGHPSLFKTFALPLSVMILAQHSLRRIPPMLKHRIEFKDGNYLNVALENMELASAVGDEAPSKRRDDLRSFVSQMFESSQKEHV